MAIGHHIMHKGSILDNKHITIARTKATPLPVHEKKVCTTKAALILKQEKEVCPTKATPICR